MITADRKYRATIAAKCALVGATFAVTQDDDGEPLFVVTHGAATCLFYFLLEIDEWLCELLGPSHPAGKLHDFARSGLTVIAHAEGRTVAGHVSTVTLLCQDCGHTQTVRSAASQLNADGKRSFYFGSRHDFCDQCGAG